MYRAERLEKHALDMRNAVAARVKAKRRAFSYLASLAAEIRFSIRRGGVVMLNASEAQVTLGVPSHVRVHSVRINNCRLGAEIDDGLGSNSRPALRVTDLLRHGTSVTLDLGALWEQTMLLAGPAVERKPVQRSLTNEPSAPPIVYRRKLKA